MKQISRWAAGAALAVTAMFAPAAQAAITEDTGNIEIFAGWYAPEEDIPGENLDDLTYGLRGGYNFTSHFMLQFGLQRFDTDYRVVGGTVDIDQWMFDVSFGWMVNPEDRGVFMLYGGPGWANTDIDVPVGKDFDDSSLSLHLGVAGLLEITPRFYMRPDGRYRWIDGDSNNDDRGDWEVTLGFGWALGNVGQ